jgi:DNA (cytosine-5)-methyltransferase 3A
MKVRYKTMKVLSLFDGISCGMVALEKMGVKADTYYASEIDKNAIAISQKNYPNIVRLGDVTKWREWDIDWSQIDLLIGGSPCQGFSFAGKQLNFDDPRSKLFFEFVDILNHIKSKNPNVKFLLENVKMKKEYVQTITDYLGVEPIEINSELVSAQNRKRLYWTNIENVTIPEDKGIEIKDIICEVEQEELIGKFKNCIRKNVVSQYDEIISSSKKIHQLKCSSGWQDNKVGITKTPTLRAGNSFCLIKTPENKIRLITITEAERLQNLPDGYTEGVADNNRFSAIGNGWTVDVIAHILKGVI